MGKGKGLLEVMNDVSHRLDACTPLRRVSREPLNEIQAFMQMDPLLCNLNKEYLDAKAIRVQAEKDYGRHDGMTDMAMVMEDSAWCAMQTRYMELRSDRAMMAQAQAMMAESVLEEERAARAEKEKDALRTFEQMQMFERLHAAHKKRDDDFWLWAVLVLWGQKVFFTAPAAPVFNRLAA